MASATAIDFDFEAEIWPVLLCEPSPGLYAIRISHETLVKIWPSTESETDGTATSHVDLDAIRKAGHIDVKTGELVWQPARAILTYWAALKVSRDKWDIIDSKDTWDCLNSILHVLFTSRDRLRWTEEGLLSTLTLPDPER